MCTRTHCTDINMLCELLIPHIRQHTNIHVATCPYMYVCSQFYLHQPIFLLKMQCIQFSYTFLSIIYTCIAYVTKAEHFVTSLIAFCCVTHIAVVRYRSVLVLYNWTDRLIYTHAIRYMLYLRHASPHHGLQIACCAHLSYQMVVP